MKPITPKSISYECCENCHNDFGKMLDYCGKCGRNLCASCMAEGHCGEVPAMSGNAICEIEVQELTIKMWNELHPQSAG
jgi:hypothetical protein